MRRAKSLTLVCVILAALSAAACKDATGPRSSLSIALSVTGVDGPHIADEPDGSASLECVVGIRATASGAGSAAWVGATIRYFVGVSGEPPVDSVRMTASELRQAWGGPTIGANSVLNSVFTFVAPYPFGATIDYEFRPDDTKNVEKVSATFHCGPEVAKNAPAPSISPLEVTPVGGVLQPGGQVDVTFQATSTVGIWQSLVVLDGGCEVQQLFAERLATTVLRGARLTIPTDCSPGESLIVSVYVLDAGLREESRTLGNALPILDNTAPTLTPVLLSPFSPGVSTPLEGTFFTGDTLLVQFNAADNHRLAWIVWEVTPFGLRDSVSRMARGAEPLVKIPVPDSWSGPFTLRLVARDSSGRETTVESAPDAMQVLPTATATMLVDTIQSDPADMILDIPRDRIYIMQSLQDRVAAFSLTTLQPVWTVPLNGHPRDMDITVDGDLLLVATTIPQLTVIDLRQSTITGVEVPLALDPALNQYSSDVAALADGRVLITLGSFSQGITANHMHEIDMNSGAQRRRTDVTEDGIVRGSTMRRSDDGRRVFVSSNVGARTYDLSTDTFSPEIGQRLTIYSSTDATGSHVAIGLGVFDGNLSPIRTLDDLPGETLTASQISPSGANVAHAWQHRGIMVANTSDGRMMYRLTIPFAISQMRFTPDGKVLVGAGSLPGGQQSVLVRYDLP